MNAAQAMHGATERLKSVWYRARGNRPFTTGYAAYKEERLREVLGRGEFSLDRLPEAYGVDLDERIIEYPWLFAHLPAGPGVLLDAGSALNFGFLLKRPALAEKTIYICTLAPERESFWQRGISYTFQDLRHTCFRDRFFDHVVSLSTLEHVGLDNGRYTGGNSNLRDPGSHIAAVREIGRILRPGGRFYFSVPYGRHADLGWLQVFDGAMLDRVIEAFAPDGLQEKVYRYTAAGWRLSDRHDSLEAGYMDLHTRSWQRGQPVAAESVACLVLTR